jgi:predicted phosphodiesterase
MKNKGRTFVVGDIHGCHQELMTLLETVNFTANDRVIAVGDLIVKGPANKQVLDLFISDRRFSSVLGNHDLAVLQYLKKEEHEYTKAQIEAGQELEHDRKRYKTYLSSLPLHIEFKSFLVVHAGVRPGVPLCDQKKSDLLELRTLAENPKSRTGVPWYEVYDEDRVVFFGHWPQRKPRRGPKAIGLDTGCVYGHQLTAYLVETQELFSVPARHAFSPRPGNSDNSQTESELPNDKTLNVPASTKLIHAAGQ